MENLVEIFAKYGSSPATHETLAGIFRNKLNEQQSIKKKEYFGVVDICNPLKTYFKFTYPEEFKDSIETKKKFSVGNKQHKITEKKIEKIDGFVDKEVILDGELIGIPLKGRADAKVKSSIWEIKSKEVLPENKEDLIEKYPQDLEQLCFYSILDPEKPVENYIIFTNQTGQEKYKAFKIKILDFGKIKTLALTRIKKLNEWLEGKEPDSIKCRHCYGDCIFKTNGICSQHENEDLPCGVEKFIEIEEAPEIEKILGEITLYNLEEDLINYSISNLIMPRKAFHRENEEDIEEEGYDGTERQINKQLIQDLIYKSNFSISSEDFKNLENSKKIKEIYQNKSSFIKLVSNGKEVIFPILIHISESNYPSSLNKVSDYKKGELGIHCFNNGLNKSYIISIFPRQNNELRVFEVTYNFPKEAIKPVKEIVEILKSKDKERVKELPLCPGFIHEKECVYREICPKE